jgi:dihydrolipoamide dehydrogenase
LISAGVKAFVKTAKGEVEIEADILLRRRWNKTNIENIGLEEGHAADRDKNTL